jgi:hypothetical protein
MTNEDIDHLARKRANAKLGWLMHAVIYVIVNALLVALPIQLATRLLDLVVIRS